MNDCIGREVEICEFVLQAKNMLLTVMLRAIFSFICNGFSPGSSELKFQYSFCHFQWLLLGATQDNKTFSFAVQCLNLVCPRGLSYRPHFQPQYRDHGPTIHCHQGPTSGQMSLIATLQKYQLMFQPCNLA